MSLFCFLWPPLFYLWWRSYNEEAAESGGVWALVLGSIAALTQFFLGSLISPGGFGFSRWVSACIDIVAVPAALPFVICFLLALLRIIPAESSFTTHAFLWLIPVAALRALSWSAGNDPILLIAVPVLWTAIVVGMGWFISFIQSGWSAGIVVPSAFAAIALPLVGATSYWAFFCQYTVLGFTLFFAALVPAGICLGMTIAEQK
jgi:hypothetical protein